VLRPRQEAYLRARRILEALCAGALLLVFSPVIAAAGLLVKLTSPGPIIYSQVRLGRDGEPYVIYKLRTMWNRCEQQSGVRWAVANDPRSTWIGKYLRQTHIDELPQLWNVVRGDMSLIGPRPERPEFVPALEQAVPRYRDRLVVRPGITGLAQLHLPADSDLESVRRKVLVDRYYVRHVDWWLDLRILLGTPFYLLHCRALGCRLLALPGLDIARTLMARETMRVDMEATWI
jgi:lipopolysaccharide/colanic/teichoic acid biosynthesis glycosyltransferase